MKARLFIIGLLCAAINAFSQAPDTLWTRTYGGALDEWANKVIPTNDGGYALAGATYSFGAGDRDVYLVKADAEGNVQWEQTYGGTSSEDCLDFQQTADGGYILVGFTRSFGGGTDNIYLVKTDSGGNELWYQSLGDMVNEDIGCCVIQTADGGYLLSGISRMSGLGGKDFYVIKTNENGDAVWEYGYGTTADDVTFDMVQSGDGGYVIAGYSEGGPNGADIYILKIDSQGLLQWENFYGGQYSDIGRSIIQTADGGFVIAATTNNPSTTLVDVLLIKTDSFGNEINSNTIGGVESDYPYDLIEVNDGSLYVVGSTSSIGSGMDDFYFFKTDSVLDLKWETTLGGVSNDEAYSVLEINDGSGFMIAGMTESFGAGAYDFYLIRTGLENTLSGPLSGTIGPGEYHVVGDISVANGDSLIIEPGVTMLFDGEYKFQINGYIYAVGTETDSIIFQPAHPDSVWKGLKLIIPCDDNSEIGYCSITRSVDFGAHISYCSPSVFNSLIANNSTPGSGGAFYIVGSGTTITDCDILNNYAISYGGGVCLVDVNGILIEGCKINNNTLPSLNSNGGGIYIQYSGNVQILNTEIENNQCHKGGGIYILSEGETLIEGCTIESNEAFGDGAGILIPSSSTQVTVSNTTISNCHVKSNIAHVTCGGIYTGSNLSPVISECVVEFNSADEGGGIMTTGGALIENCTVCNNIANVHRGGGVELHSSNGAIVRNCLIAFNNGLGGLTFFNSSGSTVEYNDIYDNIGGNITGNPEIAGLGSITTTNANGDPCDIYNNIFLDPQFSTDPDSTYRLTEDSPCIDAGDPASALDPDGTVADIGAYYFDYTPLQSNGITIQASLTTETEQLITDFDNFAGLDSNATDGYDTDFEVPEPAAPPSNFVSLYFPHSEWGSPLGDNFMYDVRNGNDDLSDAVKTYNFLVETDIAGDTVNLDFVIGEDYISGYGVILYDYTEIIYQNLRADNSYSFIADANSREFNLIIGDSTPPLIEINLPEVNSVLAAGDQFIFDYTLTDISPISEMILDYSLDDGNVWTVIDTVTVSTGNINWTVPDTFSAYSRIRVTASDIHGYSNFTSSERFWISPVVYETEYTAGWHLVSIPLELADNSVEAVFGDDVSGYYYVYDYCQTSGGFNLVETVETGKGYWLALDTESTVDFEGISSTDSSETGISGGWNIIGSSFMTDFDLDSLMFRSGNILMSYSQAVDSSWILPDMFIFNPAGGSYEQIQALIPAAGVWFYTLMDGLSLVSYPSYPVLVEDDEDTREIKGRQRKTNIRRFDIPITLAVGEYYNKSLIVGMHSNASDGYDPWFDGIAPPLPPGGGYLRGYLNHPEWNCPVDNFCRDIRESFPSNKEIPLVKEWEITVESSENGELTVDFKDIMSNLPEGFSATAAYFENTVIDLTETHYFTVTYSQPMEITFKVFNEQATIMGWNLDEIDRFLPVRFEIASVYPNPFNPKTSIRIALPEPSEVKIKVFNILGGEVWSHNSGYLNAGYHTFMFDGNNISSGVYFVNAVVEGEMNQIRKIVLLK